MESSFVHVGTVGKPHGLRGEVKVIPETDDPRLFEGLHALYIGPSEEHSREFEVESVRFQQARIGLIPLLKVKGYDSPEAASTLRGQLLLVDRQSVELMEDEVFAYEVVGLVVQTEDGTVIGRVTDVLESPAHDLYQVEKLDGSVALVPVVSEFIKNVDLDAELVTITPIEGLLD